MIRAGLISEDQLEFALAEQARGGDRLGVVMRRLNLVTEDAMTRVLAEAAGIEYISLRLQSIDPPSSNRFQSNTRETKSCSRSRPMKDRLPSRWLIPSTSVRSTTSDG